MTWTYDNAPSTSTAAGRRDAVRGFVGDTDTTDQQVTDEQIAFALSEANDNVYNASAIIARNIAAKYSRLVDTSIESVSASYSQRKQEYLSLAASLENQGKKYGLSLAVPVAGGISKSDVESVEDDTDRVEPSFRIGMFDNPPDGLSGDVEDWYDYHS